MVEKQTHNPGEEVNDRTKDPKMSRRTMLAAGGLAAAIAAGAGGIHALEEHKAHEAAEVQFSENRETIEGAYRTLEMSDIFDTQITSIEIGEYTPSTAGGNASNEQGLVPSVAINFEWQDGDRAEELQEALPVGENDSSELLWGPYREIRVDNYFLDEHGEKTGLMLPSYMASAEGGNPYGAHLLSLDPGGGEKTMLMPFNSRGVRKAEIYETIDISVGSTVDEDKRPPRMLERSLGAITFSVTEDGVEIVKPFEPAEETVE